MSTPHQPATGRGKGTGVRAAEPSKQHNDQHQAQLNELLAKCTATGSVSRGNTFSNGSQLPMSVPRKQVLLGSERGFGHRGTGANGEELQNNYAVCEPLGRELMALRLHGSRRSLVGLRLITEFSRKVSALFPNPTNTPNPPNTGISRVLGPRNLPLRFHGAGTKS